MYVCLFTCAVTRAVHLEVVTDLSTQTFLNAFRRFTARRSLPKKVISDNASTFCAASDEIKTLLESDQVRRYMANHRIDWIFIPCRAPNWGGFWERCVGLMKTCIKKVLGRARVTLDELTTLVTQVESVMNDRPLTYIDSEDEPLTPSHLLHGRRINTLPYPTAIDDDELTDPNFTLNEKPVMERRVRYLADLYAHFWRRFSSEYLTALRERHIAYQPGKKLNTIKVGDVVIMHSDEKRRAQWNLALVQKLNVGNDGLCRSAMVKTKHGITSRPIYKLYPLEVNHKDSSDNGCDMDAHAEPEIKRLRRSVRVAAQNAKVKIKTMAGVLNESE